MSSPQNKTAQYLSVNDNSTTSSGYRLQWVDWMRGIAIVWIFITHAVEEVFGGAYLGNPNPAWPPLQERIAQWKQLTDYGAWNIPVNMWRYIGWLGDQGVNLFLVVSGFGLTWGLLKKYKNSLPAVNFYRKRLFRIYPLWWGVHIIFLLLSYVIGIGGLDLSARDPNFYLSLLGFRASPDTFFFFSPAWWFIGLLLQLYLIYPILWNFLKRWGAVRLLLISCLVTFITRAAIILVGGDDIGYILYGSIFITRLPEFVFGICFAYWLSKPNQKPNMHMSSALAILTSFAIYVIGTLLSLTWAGTVFAPFLVGASLFCIWFGILGNKNPRHSIAAKFFSWTGRHSYSIYLIHHPIILLLVPVNALFGTLFSIPLTYFGALGLEWSVDSFIKSLQGWYRKFGFPKMVVRIGLVSLTIFLCAIGVELLVQTLDPMEIRGWGERPSLEVDDAFGWHLIPNQTTRLRWESYDYIVSSNKLGFPGPSYPEKKEPGTIRILTFGDGFTSAEGVDTYQAWPRLLESNLASYYPDHNVEVMNFAITGYGPDQYVEVAKTYIPKYRPDVVIVAFFMNDFLDVDISNSEFQSSIGFGLPTATGLYSTVTLAHSREWLHRNMRELVDKILNRPEYGEYSGVEFLLAEPQEYETGRDKVSQKLKQLKSLSDDQAAQMFMFVIPVPVQVCGPDEVTYYPQGYDLSDTNLFDLEKPQKTTREITDALNINSFDLRDPLAAMQECPYQPRNLHWTVAGHQEVAEFITRILVSRGLFP